MSGFWVDKGNNKSGRNNIVIHFLKMLGQILSKWNKKLSERKKSWWASEWASERKIGERASEGKVGERAS